MNIKNQRESSFPEYNGNDGGNHMVRLPKRRSEAFENFSLYFAIFVPLNRSQCKSYYITAMPYLLPVLLRKLKGIKGKMYPHELCWISPQEPHCTFVCTHTWTSWYRNYKEYYYQTYCWVHDVCYRVSSAMTFRWYIFWFYTIMHIDMMSNLNRLCCGMQLRQYSSPFFGKSNSQSISGR